MDVPSDEQWCRDPLEVVSPERRGLGRGGRRGTERDGEGTERTGTFGTERTERTERTGTLDDTRWGEAKDSHSEDGAENADTASVYENDLRYGRTSVGEPAVGHERFAWEVGALPAYVSPTSGLS